MNNAVNRIGTIIYGLIVGFFGVNHFLNAASMAKDVPKYLPSSIVWIYISGAALVLAAIAIIINVQSRAAGYLLFLLLAIIIGTLHVPGLMNAADETSKAMNLTMILKDGAMAAAALMVAARGK
ncbi:MAG: DoxX family protein [Bacteroidota bacterium]